jgi:hypothetical protein
MPTSPAADETVRKLKGQMLFEKKTLQLTGNVFLNLPLRLDDVSFARFGILLPHLIRQMAVEPLAEIEHFVPLHLPQELLNVDAFTRTNSSDALKFCDYVRPSVDITPIY